MITSMQLHCQCSGYIDLPSKNVGRLCNLYYTTDMHVHICTTTVDIETYDKYIEQSSHALLWQSSHWRQLQQALGRQVRVYIVKLDHEIIASAQVVIDTTTFGYSTWDIPRGPIWHEDYSEAALHILVQRIMLDAMQNKCVQMYMSPLQTLPSSVHMHSQPSNRYVFPEASIVLDCTKAEAELLAEMKPKGRYNIKVAEKNGVTVVVSTDAQAFSALHTTTAQRNNFKKPTSGMYVKFLKNLPGSFLLLAMHHDSGTAIAGLIGVLYKDVCIYYYGASDYAYRAYMAPYLLQWQAIQYAKQSGAKSYDFFGIAPMDATDHPWQELNGFKEKFGGAVVTYPTEKTIVLRPVVRALLTLKRKLW